MRGRTVYHHFADDGPLRALAAFLALVIVGGGLAVAVRGEVQSLRRLAEAPKLRGRQLRHLCRLRHRRLHRRPVGRH